MTFEKIIKDLKNKDYKPLYLLSGEEPYYIDEVTDFIINNVLSESERDFNLTTLYGLETSVEAIISHARRFPMMASHNIIIVKEAQQIRNIEALMPYVENPLKSSILVINYKNKKIDGRTKFYKAIKSTGVILETKNLAI